MMRPQWLAASLALLEQRLGRFRDKLCALALAAFEKEQALAEDEAIEQKGLCLGLVWRNPGRAIELANVFQPRRIDICNRFRRRLVRTGPLPDRKLNGDAFGVGPLRIEPNQGLQPLASGLSIAACLLLDRRNATGAPVGEHGRQQRGAVFEAAVEAAFSDA